ncbi:MAG TPA: hypothetical protein VKY45_00980 [Marinilabiliaceae bacterium]|nr:hypothetical protein [Marinilabiliaceae bacterium]
MIARNNFLLLLILVLSSTALVGQETMFLAQNNEMEESNSQLPVYHIPDYTFTDLKTGTVLRVNADGLYLHSDSALVNSIVYLYLTTEDDLASVYGVSFGLIIDGKKEGLWQKVLFLNDEEPFIVRKLRYKGGLIEGRPFYYIEPELELDPYRIIENLIFERHHAFKGGTGLFSDFHVRTSNYKSRFYLTNGKLTDSYFEIFDKEGNRVLSESYFNGYRINY